MKRTLLVVALIALNCFKSDAQKSLELEDGNGKIKLLGLINDTRLKEPPFNQWFDQEYASYIPDSSVIDRIKKIQSPKDSIVVFLGTWCGDSKREVPRFSKITTSLAWTNVTVFGVDNTFQNYKQSPLREEYALDIHRVPTFIIYKDGKEKGRIVESPIENLETDLLKILTNEPYSPKYNVVSELINIFKEKGASYIEQNIDSLGQAFETRLLNKYELNTYALKLFTSFNIIHAQLVYRLNTIIYPNDVFTFYNLGRFYYTIGDLEKSRNILNTAIQLDPENQEVKVLLSNLNN